MAGGHGAMCDRTQSGQFLANLNKNELRTHCSSRVMMLQNTIFSRFFLRIMPDLLVDGHISHLTSSGI